jgi:hypothetical protein
MHRAAGLAAALLLSAATVTAGTAGDSIGLAGAGAACTGPIDSARYGAPTMRYAHGVLGDAVEWGALIVGLRCPQGAAQVTVSLSDARVFEDTAPRLADLDGDGRPEVITVETDLRRGARLTVWGQKGGQPGRLAATPFIGTAHRWLAPVGAADLDGDGRIEIAYVDRPHLARTLRIWRYDGGRLIPVAERPGLTNHRIGEDHISGGIRDCGSGPEIITADAGWTRIVASALKDGRIIGRDIGAYDGRASLSAALACRQTGSEIKAPPQPRFFDEKSGALPGQ